LSILRAMVATRNACAGWMTCENCTGHRALSIARSLLANGSRATTVSRSSVRPDFCTVSCRRKAVEVQSCSGKGRGFTLFSCYELNDQRGEHPSIFSDSPWEARRGESFTFRFRRENRGGIKEPLLRSPSATMSFSAGRHTRTRREIAVGPDYKSANRSLDNDAVL